jgi:hypothetical protein
MLQSIVSPTQNNAAVSPDPQASPQTHKLIYRGHTYTVPQNRPSLSPLEHALARQQELIGCQLIYRGHTYKVMPIADTLLTVTTIHRRLWYRGVSWIKAIDMID